MQIEEKLSILQEKYDSLCKRSSELEDKVYVWSTRANDSNEKLNETNKLLYEQEKEIIKLNDNIESISRDRDDWHTKFWSQAKRSFDLTKELDITKKSCELYKKINNSPSFFRSMWRCKNDK